MTYVNSLFTGPITQFAIEKLFGTGNSSSSTPSVQPVITSTTSQKAPVSAAIKSAAAKIDATLLERAEPAAQPVSSPTSAAIAAYTSTDGRAPRASTPGGPISAAGGEFSVDYVFAASWGEWVERLRGDIQSVRMDQEILNRSPEDQIEFTRTSMERMYGKERADAWVANSSEAFVVQVKEDAAKRIQQKMEGIDGYIAEIKARFKVDGDFTTTDENGLIGRGSFSLTYETSKEIGHLSVGSNWLLGTTDIDYTITRKDTGDVRRGDILNYKITR